MLTSIREGLGKIFALVILLLIAISFIFWGVDFGLTSGTIAARVNGEDVSLYEFDQALRFREQQAVLGAQGNFDVNTRNQLRQEVINALVADKAILQRSQDRGFVVSDDDVATAIANRQEFRIGDEFSFDIYQSRLINEGITPDYYESLQRNALQLGMLQQSITGTSFILPYEFRLALGLLTERRRFSYAQFDVASYINEDTIPDESVEIYYNANSQNYVTEPSITLEVLEITSDTMTDDFMPTESSIEEYYQANIERFVSDEQRRASHILFEPGNFISAEQVLDRLNNGEAFNDLALEFSVDQLSAQNGGDLGFISRGLYPDSFDQALYSLESVGDYTQIVETQFGLHIIRLDELELGQSQPIEEVRDILIAELELEAQGSAFYEKSIQLADLIYQNNTDLDFISSSLGIDITRYEGVTPVDSEINSTILTNAFNAGLIDSGSTSPLIEISENHIAVIRVSDYVEPQERSLDEVTDLIRGQLARSDAERIAFADAEAFLERLQSALENGEDIPNIASQFNATWNEPRWVSRNGELNETPIELANASYTLQKPDLDSYIANITQLQSGDPVVMILSAVEMGSTEALDEFTRQSYGIQLTDLNASIEYDVYVRQAVNDADINISQAVITPIF
ncbi:MAG: SurA N-terminal domain-containing protein [Gammaproteobacteria bacterium]